MTDRVTAAPGLFMSEATSAGIDPRTLDALKTADPGSHHTLIFGPGDFTPEGKATPQLTEQFNKVGFDASTALGSKLEENMSYAAGSGMAISGDKLSPLMDSFADNACIVTVPMEGGEIDMNGHVYDLQKPQDYALASLGVSPEWMDKERIPGKENDMQSWVAHHESDHCRNLKGDHYEYRSDAYANQQYAQDLLAGRVQDAELPYFVRSQRAAMQMLGVESETYATAAFSPLAGEKPLSDAVLDTAAAQVGEARERIYDSIGKKTGMDMHDRPEDQDQRVSRLRVIYTESKLLTEQGALDDLPYGKTATERFIDGAERYGHALYDVMPEHQISALPSLPNPAMDLSPAFLPRTNMGLNGTAP